MKKLVLFTVVLLSFTSSFAQKVHFCDTSNVWSLIDSNVGCCIPIPVKYTTAYFDSTTFSYNGNSYRYLVTSIATIPVRESAGKVYFLDLPDSVEKVMYDFNLVVNDTLRTNYAQDKYIAWVTSIDSTQLAGIWYKRWHFLGTDSVLYFPDSVRALSYNVIEGLGCTNGPGYPASPYSLVSFSQQLLCFKNGAVASSSPLSSPTVAYGYTYVSYFDNDSSCASFYADHGHSIIGYNAVGQVSVQPNEVIVAPNPATETTSIFFPATFKSGTIVVVNDIGQSVFNSTFTNKESVLVGDRLQARGVYFYRVINNENGQSFSGKIIK